MISAIIGGSYFENFISCEVGMSLLSIERGFRFTMSAEEYKKSYPIKKGDKAIFKVDGNKVLDGYVRKVNIKSTEKGNEIIFEGSHKTCDIVESTPYSTFNFTKKTTILDVVKQLLTDVGIDSDVINETGEVLEISNYSAMTSEMGETIFDFIEQYCRQKSILLATNEDGDVVFTRGKKSIAPHTLNRTLNKSNIVESELIIDDSCTFGKYVVKAQPNFAISDGIKFENWTDIKSELSVSGCRPSRIFVGTQSQPSTQEELEKMAKWIANARISKSKIYKCKVSEHSYSKGKIYEPNYIFPIEDEFCGVKTKMRLIGAKYCYADNKNYTRLMFMNGKSFTIDADINDKGIGGRYTDV